MTIERKHTDNVGSCACCGGRARFVVVFRSAGGAETRLCRTCLKRGLAVIYGG